jgi:hypothetical protein
MGHDLYRYNEGGFNWGAGKHPLFDKADTSYVGGLYKLNTVQTIA